MMMKRTVLMLAFAVLPATFAHANLITNGSFEATNQASVTWSVYGSIPGWTSTLGTGIEIQDHVAGSPYDGDQHVELDSHNNSNELDSHTNSNMRQQIGVTPGALYDLSFAYSPRPGVAATSTGIEVWFDGLLIDTVAASGIGLQDTNWTIQSYTVSPVGNLVNLEFLAVGTSDSLGGYIDDVQLTPTIPVPGAIVLGALGTSLVGWMRRRRTL